MVKLTRGLIVQRSTPGARLELRSCSEGWDRVDTLKDLRLCTQLQGCAGTLSELVLSDDVIRIERKENKTFFGQRAWSGWLESSSRPAWPCVQRLAHAPRKPSCEGKQHRPIAPVKVVDVFAHPGRRAFALTP